MLSWQLCSSVRKAAMLRAGKQAQLGYGLPRRTEGPGVTSGSLSFAPRLTISSGFKRSADRDYHSGIPTLGQERLQAKRPAP